MAACSTTLHGILDEAVSRRPGHVCLRMGTDSGLTYEDVRLASVRCAGHVVALGAKPGIVLLCADRSYGMLVAMLGTMRAGWAYCPIEPDFPRGRVAAMIETADISYCLTPVAQAPHPIVASFTELTTLAVYDDGLVKQDGALAPATPECVPDRVSDSATAYVLFTSGSTGKPKGCMVPHRGSALYAHSVVKSCRLDSNMTFLFKTPYVFDVSIQDIYTAFSAAGTLVLAEPDAHKDAGAIATLVAAQGINCMAFTPTLLVEFVNHLARNAEDATAVGQTLARVLTIGEALMAATCIDLIEVIPSLDGEIHNLYGPTEASVGVSHFQVSIASMGQSVVVPIGVPFDYVEFRCFDAARYEDKTIEPALLVETQLGETGELFIGGDCLAHGYLKNAEKTEAAFFEYLEVLARPKTAASRFSLYKSGDLVRCRPDGVFEILGRNDFQVKIGGVRIECEEISAVLKTHPSIDDALVTVFDGPFGKTLAAYIVKGKSEESDISSTVSSDSCTRCGSVPEVVGMDESQIVEGWGAIYDEQYAQAASRVDPTLDWSGYDCSYTRGPHLESVVAEWAEWSCEPVLRKLDARRSLDVSPCRVAEIGCGVGMLLFRIAPSVCAGPLGGHYSGIDVSKVALEHVRSVHESFKQYSGLSISTTPIAAHQLADVCAPRSQDVVLCNSVSQYFTGAKYLLNALQVAVECVKPGGAVIFGDILSRRHHFILKMDVEVFQAFRVPEKATLASSILESAKMKTAVDPNIFYDDSLFHRLECASDALFEGRLARVELRLKRGMWHSEFTRFRFDAELILADDAVSGEAQHAGLHLERVDCDTASSQLDLVGEDGRPRGPAPGVLEDWVSALVTKLADLTDGVVITLPNARTIRSVHLTRWIEEAAAQGLLLDDMPQWLHPVDASDAHSEFGVEPEDLFELCLPAGWTSRVIFAEDPAMLELVLLRERIAGARWLSAVRNCGSGALSADELATMANGADAGSTTTAISKNTSSTTADTSLLEWNKALKDWVAQTSLLPVMRPQVYISLDAFPKNAAGKLDRGALPSASEILVQLSNSCQGTMVHPTTDDERKMVACWERVLHKNVCVETPFVAYGGHSLIALALRSDISKTFGVFLPAALITSESCTVRALLQEIQTSKALVNEDREVTLPLVIERTVSTFFYLDCVDPRLYVASHPWLRFLPASMMASVYFYYVPSVEVELEVPVSDLEGLVTKLIEAHPILRSRYSQQRSLIIPDTVANAADYYSWDSTFHEARHAILGMYDRPLFRLIGHRRRGWHAHGPAVSVTVLWHHIISDANSDDIVKRDIRALVRGESLRPADLSAYDAFARHPLSKSVHQDRITDIDRFSLARRACCDVTSFRGRVAHSFRMMAAVSHRPFAHDLDKARFILDALCAVTGQLRGRFGLLKNARGQVDKDASNLLGALLFNVEYVYDSTTGELESLGHATDGMSGVCVNLHDVYRDFSSVEILGKLGFSNCERIVAGDVECSIPQRFSGACGVNFAEGEGLYIECLTVADGTIFLATYPDALYEALDVVQGLHRHLTAND